MHIQKNIPLNDKNWFSTGGPARFFCEPTTEMQFVQAVQYARDHALEIFVLGAGANILISDDGFDGLVIRPQLKQIVSHPGDPLVTAGAGADIQELIDCSLDLLKIGLEDFSGIPGTVGGAMYINIHYFKHLLSNFVVSARVIEAASGLVYDVAPDWFGFGYNQTKLLEKKHFLISATFALKPVDLIQAAYARGRRDEIIRHRTSRYPNANTCGSFFRNFHDHEIPDVIHGKKIPFVAYYLDKIGVKGALSVGGAVVSYQHANMLVTQPQATSSDVINLARIMQQKVIDQFGLKPQPECQLIGFKYHPLL